MLKIIQYIAFFGLAIVSTGLGIILYTGLSHDLLSFAIMLIVAGVIEAVKILCLTWYNTVMWQSNQIKNLHIDDYIRGMFKPHNKSKIKNGALLKAVNSYNKHRRDGNVRFIVYLFAAFLSVSASYGYISQTIYLTTQSKVILTTIDTQNIYKDKLNSIDERIKQDKKLNIEYAKSQSLLDSMYDEDFQKKYDAYQKKIDKNNDDIQKQLELKQGNNDTLQNLKLKDTQQNQTKGKNMYQLMGESLGLSERTVMFILLYLLAIMIEVGLFITSPHFNIMDKEDEETEDRVKGMMTPIEGKESIIKSMYNPDSKSRMNTVTPAPDSSKNAHILSPSYIEPVTPEQIKEYHSHTAKPELLIVPAVDYDGLQEAIINPPIPTEALKDLMQERVSQPEALPVVEMVDVPIKHVDNAEIKVVNLDVPIVRKTVDKTKVIDAFIDNLFDENGRMLNKENVANKVGLSLIHAIKIVEFLTHSPYVQFRPPVSYFKIGTITDIKKAIGKLYSSGGTNEKV